MAASQNCLMEIKTAFNSISRPDGSMTTLLGLMKLAEILKQSDECAENTFCSEMVSSNLPKLSLRYLCQVKSSKHCIKVLMLLQNISFSSKKFSESIVESGVHKLIASNIENNTSFSVQNLNKNPKQEDAHEMMFGNLRILQNTMKNYPECRAAISASKLKYALKKLLSVEDLLMKSCALMCLAYAVNVDKDQSLLTLQKNDIDFLTRRILPATPHLMFGNNSDETRLKYDTGSLSFGTDEILEPISILVTNPNSTLELVKQGIVSICQSVLIKAHQIPVSHKDNSLTSATKWSLLILYRLSKRPYIGQLIDFKNLITKFSDHPIDVIAEIANGILTALNDSGSKTEEKQDESDCSKTETLSSDVHNLSVSEKDDDTDKGEKIAQKEDAKFTQQIKVETAEDSDKSSKDHIMISYCHQQKDIADRLLKELRKNGVKYLWIDQEHLHKASGTVQGMVSAVDNAKSVICCISEAYSKSANCIGELAYAKSKKKNIIPVVVEKNFSPDGELLFYLKDSFRFNISTDDLFRTNCQMLLQKLAADDEK